LKHSIHLSGHTISLGLERGQKRIEPFIIPRSLCGHMIDSLRQRLSHGGNKGLRALFHAELKLLHC
jgi:hypothetical protein